MGSFSHGLSGAMNNHMYQERSVVKSNMASGMELSMNHNFNEPPPTINHRTNGHMNQIGATHPSEITRKSAENMILSNGMHSEQIPVPNQAIYTDQFLQTLRDLSLLGNIHSPTVPANHPYSYQQQNTVNSLAFYGEAIKNQLLSGNVGLHIHPENPFSVPPPNNLVNSPHPIMIEPPAEKPPQHNAQSNDYLAMNSTAFPAGISGNCGQAYACSQNFFSQPPGIATNLQMEQ